MKNIPDKCFRCGAPIKWDKSSNYIDCEFCGYTNLINLGSFSNLINSIKIAKKLSINLFHKGQKSSKSIFVKAKNSSSYLLEFKKFIFIISITALSAVILGKVLEKEKVPIAKSYKPNVPINDPYIPKIPSTFRTDNCKISSNKKYLNVGAKKIDSRFFGIWKQEDGDNVLYEIKTKGNSIDIISWSDNLKENFIVSGISWKPDIIFATSYMPSSNYRRVSRIKIQDNCTLYEEYKSGGNKNTLKLLKYHYQ